ncbi:2-C-methyl-D-erythritol 2,4-cyclodiphosphate synthase [Pirellulaceae bacterium]|jgi:2-C-methyl-D-erythritol 2,4-cyclodiphosphate synthase|nr:2-C-methyl-D-erythritol 2,4-cyclodiphosphate synthase [Pirellulaceae bacterium]
MLPKQELIRLRVGIGHDTHRLASGGPLMIGGVSVQHDYHAVGHSDADVLLHAITDAILGASDLGDIGEMFPNTDPANKGRDSIEMLSLAMAKVKVSGFSIINLDCIVFAQRPKLSQFKPAIRQRIARALELDASQIGLKAKTGEGVDAVGNEKAIQAQCVALLFRE